MRIAGLKPKRARFLCAAITALATFSCTPKRDPRQGRVVPTAPKAPSALSVTNGDGYATVSWSNVQFASSYRLFWSTTSGSFSTSQMISSVSSPFFFGGLKNGENMYVSVQAIGGLGASDLSSEATLLGANGSGSADTLFANQWHLDNTGQIGTDGNPATAGEDVNVAPAWASCGVGNSCRGEGVRVAVVDTGIDLSHEDLKVNIFPGLSYSYVNGNTSPSDSHGHGTAVSGIIAARDLNDLGVRGVAPRASLAAFDVIGTGATIADATDALTKNISFIDVSNNSWGPGLGFLGCTTDVGGDASRTAFTTGTTSGRGGLGTIYVVAAGNGHEGGSYDGLTCGGCQGVSNLNRLANDRHVITAGALTALGAKSTYSEIGANLLVSAPGGQYCSTTLAVTSTDITGASSGLNKTGASNELANTSYTQCMNGTSSAAPNTSGVVALVLQANPLLTWRDVRQILATTARFVDPTDPGWATNSAGIRFNPKYGHGAVDASAAVTAAAAWVNLGAEVVYDSGDIAVGTAIPDADATGVLSNHTVAASGITNIEYVEVTFTSTDHLAPGDLEITLENTTTAGGAGTLVPAHNSLDPAGALTCNDIDGLYNAFTLGTNWHLNEAADGVWRLTVKDLVAADTGTFQTWRLKIYGR